MVGAICCIPTALRRAGILPAGYDLLPSAEADGSGRDLLPDLLAAWRAAAAPRTRAAAGHHTQWLARQQAVGAQLTLGIPGLPAATMRRWLGYRLAWWPAGAARAGRVGLASSRLGRTLDGQTAWFTALRTACAKIDPRHEMLVTAAATTTARFVQRSAQLLNLPLLRIQVPRDDAMSLQRWFQHVRKSWPEKKAGATPPASVVWLSPPLASAAGPDMPALPVRDRALVVCSHRLFVFRVRPGGHVGELVNARLRDPAWATASVRVALGPCLVRRSVAAQLLDLGAVGWMVPEVLDSTDAAADRPLVAAVESTAARPPRRAADRAPIVPVPEAADGTYLSHCTRRRAGPWPGQTQQDYLDDLILARADAQHSALAALLRIVHAQRLIASAEGVRGARPVVSFTDVPLADLERLRVFRPHRGRWDFQPYGICIRRRWLQEQGTQPVRYGDEPLWESLPAAERPFFQLCRTRARRGARPIDWTVEREWRHAGDLDLRCLPGGEGLLFVPTHAEAQRLTAVSPWPVTVLGRRQA